MTPFALTVSLTFVLVVPTAAADNAATYLKDGRLTAELKFTSVQGGFAGFTGNTWNVKPDGSWTVTRVFNRRKFKPHLSGKLDAKQLKRLADALAKAGIARLKGSVPSRGANPKVITVRYGKAKYSHSLSAGVSNPKEVKDKTGRAMLTLSKTIEMLMPWRKKPATR
ncbi:MAG: hypothetical protein ACE5KM_00480 [Planctomycetaceae bacterium]